MRFAVVSAGMFLIPVGVARAVFRENWSRGAARPTSFRCLPPD